jgi:hypothetical protein
MTVILASLRSSQCPRAERVWSMKRRTAGYSKNGGEGPGMRMMSAAVSAAEKTGRVKYSDLTRARRFR